MSIKPVAWMVSWIFDDKVYRSAHLDRSVAERVCKREGTEEIEELYAIPDTHRIVPVELLSSIMELAGVALVYQPFGTKDRQNFHALMAIIEDKP